MVAQFESRLKSKNSRSAAWRSQNAFTVTRSVERVRVLDSLLNLLRRLAAAEHADQL